MKKVILLLMEGPSDEDALLAPTKAAISDVLVDSECFHTDVTTASLFPYNASFDVSSDVSKTVGDFVDSYLDKNPGYDWGDLAAVIQVIDLDGALVRPDSVIEDWSTHKIQYGDEAISTPDRDFLLRRNRVKTASIKKLCNIETIGKGRKKIPYRIFFMSRNLEHALYGISRELCDEEKEQLSFAYAKTCRDKPSFFLDSLKDEAIAVPGGYEETWRHCFQGTNSLKRGSNYHLLFDMASRLFNLG